jgi:ATP-dependent Lon protease
MEEIPKEVSKDIRFVFVSHMDEVLKVALTKHIPGFKEIKGEKEKKPNLTVATPTLAD